MASKIKRTYRSPTERKIKAFLNPFFLTLILMVLILPIFIDSVSKKQQAATKANYQLAPTLTPTPTPTPRIPLNQSYNQ